VELQPQNNFGLESQLPMFFIQGELDALTVTSEVRAFYADLRAPSKGFWMIEGGRHSSYLIRERVLAALTERVLAALTERVLAEVSANQ
jgi:alpha-beta hydrolase superfamily lysophospholipase